MTSRGAAEMTKNENRQPSMPAFEELDQRRNVVAQANPPAGLLEVLAAHAAELGIVAEQVGQLPSLLHEIAAASPSTFCWKSGGADQLAEHQP